MGATPFILLQWFYYHKRTLKEIADGEPVIVVPHKNDTPFTWQLEGRTIYYRPYHGPRPYLGANASFGMLRSWSNSMAVICGLIAIFGIISSKICWFGGAGYMFLLVALMYFEDLCVTSPALQIPTFVFATAHLPAGIVLMLSFARLMNRSSLSTFAFEWGMLLSLLIFLYCTTYPIPSDDIVYDIKKWKKKRSKLSRRLGRWS